MQPHDHSQCVGRAVATAEATCARRGVRLTALRRRILELVWGCHAPVKAYDILDRLRRERHGAAPPTVYRILDLFMEEGLVHRIESLNAYIGCEQPGTPHAGQFLICEHCRSVTEMREPAITELVVQQAERVGFRVARQTIEVYGVCTACREAAQCPDRQDR